MKRILFLVAILTVVYTTTATAQTQTQDKAKKSCCVKRTKHNQKVTAKKACNKSTCTTKHVSKCKNAASNKAKKATKCPYLNKQKELGKKVKCNDPNASKCPYLRKQAKKACSSKKKKSCCSKKK